MACLADLVKMDALVCPVLKEIQETPARLVLLAPPGLREEKETPALLDCPAVTDDLEIRVLLEPKEILVLLA